MMPGMSRISRASARPIPVFFPNPRSKILLILFCRYTLAVVLIHYRPSIFEFPRRNPKHLQTGSPVSEGVVDHVVEDPLEEPVSEDLRIFGIDFDTDVPHRQPGDPFFYTCVRVLPFGCCDTQFLVVLREPDLVLDSIPGLLFIFDEFS